MEEKFVAEHFEIGNDRKKYVQEVLGRIRSVQLNGLNLKAMLNKNSRGLFSCVIEGRILHKAVTGHGASQRFQEAVNQARNQVVRQIRRLQDKQVTARKRAHETKMRFLGQLA